MRDARQIMSRGDGLEANPFQSLDHQRWTRVTEVVEVVPVRIALARLLGLAILPINQEEDHLQHLIQVHRLTCGILLRQGNRLPHLRNSQHLLQGPLHQLLGG